MSATTPDGLGTGRDGPPRSADDAQRVGFFDRRRTCAPRDYNRFLVPPAALAVHLSIGQAYAFSTFNLPLSTLLGGEHATPDDWSLVQIGWTFSIAIFVLGVSAAIFGRWVERVGPRKAIGVAAVCFGGGFLVAALGIATHQLTLLYLGYGVLGGCGLGIGYIAPVSTLIKWFPGPSGHGDRHGDHGFWRRRDDRGAAVVVPDGALPQSGIERRRRDVRDHGMSLLRLHDVRRSRGARAAGGLAAGRLGRTADSPKTRHAGTRRRGQGLAHAAVLAAMGRAVHERHGRHRRARPGLADDPGDVRGPRDAGSGRGLRRLVEPVQHGGTLFLGLDLGLSRPPQHLFRVFLLGIVLYATVPSIGRAGSIVGFVAAFALILSMYGGGFATIPAYLRDMFGTMHVGAIHGRVLTAWACAGVLGPVLVNYLRQYQIDNGVAKAQAYSVTMYVMCGMLLIGLLCNLGITAVHPRHHHPPGEDAR